MMMSLGLFVFGLDTAAYQEFQRQTSWKHPNTSRVGARDAYQFTGPGEDTITLTGWIAPELTGDPNSIDTLRRMGDTGKAWVLVEGTGRIFGTFFIDNINESRKHINKLGLGKRIDFTIVLKRADEDDPSKLGDLDQFRNLIGAGR